MRQQRRILHPPVPNYHGGLSSRDARRLNSDTNPNTTMSHEIIKHRFVATFTEPENHPGFTAPYTYILFISFQSSNNVSPRTYNGEMFAHDGSFSSGDPHLWNGEVMLPSMLWQCAYSADGGMIKSYPGRDITGIGWIRSWKELARRPLPLAMEDGRLIVPPTLSVWLPKNEVEAIAKGEHQIFTGYHAEHDIIAWQSLVAPSLTSSASRGYYPNNFRISINTTAELAHAMRLIGRTKPKDFSMHLVWNEWQADNFVRLQAQMPEIPKPAPKPSASFKPGVLIELHGHRYTLTEKRKASWLANRQSDGRLFKISPRHWAAAKVIESAA